MLGVVDARLSIADPLVPDAIRCVEDVRGGIEFRHLTLAYGDRVVLENVSAMIPAGTTTAVVGPTGSGKSTLLATLPRLADAPRGSVFIDGVDIHDIPLAVLRGAIGFVPQEPFLFSTTVADNIAFGVDPREVTPAAIAAAASVARLDKDIESFPKGYDTMVGERGITLSGGQKQRTAIA